MTPERMNAKLAEWAGVTPIPDHWYAAEVERGPTPFWASSKMEVELWLDGLPSNSAYKGYKVFTSYLIPDYPNDLNAVRELELKLRIDSRVYSPGGAYRYIEELCSVMGVGDDSELQEGDVYVCVTASALQRCIALCRTLDLWEDK